MPEFNPKSPLEFSLDLATEEAAEIIQSIGKIKRFNMHHRYPRTQITNIDHLQQELYDFTATIKQVNAELAKLDLPQLRFYDQEAVQAKLEKMHRYANMSIEEGMLAEPLAEVKLNILSGML